MRTKLITILIILLIAGVMGSSSMVAANLVPTTINGQCECGLPDLITYYVTPADHGLYYIVEQRLCGDGAVFDCKILDEMKYQDAVNEMEQLLACD